MRKYKSKKLIFISVSYILTLCVLLGLAVYFSTAKYTAEINGRINIEPSSFNAYLLGTNTVAQLTAVEDGEKDSSGEAKSIKVFGTSINIENLEPGMDAKEIPFSVTNGTSSADVASIPVEYTIQVKTTGNIPLEFKLLEKQQQTNGGSLVYDANGDPVFDTLHEYITATRYTVEVDETGDAPKYVYTFCLESDTLQNEQKFTLSGNTLESDCFSLSIEWPIGTTESGEATNSGTYMKEVDIVEVYVTASAAKNEDNHQNDQHSTGIIGLYNSNADAHISYSVTTNDGENGTTTVTISADSFVHTTDFRAYVTDDDFKDYLNNTLSIAATSAYTYDFKVSNGNTYCTDGVETVYSGSTRTYYTVQIKVPYNVDTEDYKYAVRVRDIHDYDNDGDYEDWILLDMPEESTEIRSYNTEYGTDGYGSYTVLDPDDTSDATTIANYLANGDYSAEKYKLYKVYYLFAPVIYKPGTSAGDIEHYIQHAGTEELVMYLTNLDNTANPVLAETDFLLSVYNSSSLKNGDLPIDSRPEILVDCVYSNSQTGEDVPHSTTVKSSDITRTVTEEETNTQS